MAKNITRAAAYASSADFCRIFHEDMDGLYLLALLLTADPQKAEQCFVSGLDDSVEGNPVFKEWARSWARRSIIQNAVRLIQPRPGVERDGRSGSGSSDRANNSFQGNDTLAAEWPAEMSAVLALTSFDRFVYVMTVLEHYSDYECSLLLACVPREVITARTRVFERLGSAMEIHYQQSFRRNANTTALHERRNSLLRLMAVPRLVQSV